MCGYTARMRSWLLLSSLLCLSLASCKNSESEDRPKLDMAKFSDVGLLGNVELISAGEEPRRELRFLFAEGTKEEIEMRVNMKSKTNAGGQAVAVDMGMIFDMNAEILELPAPDRARISFLIDSFDMDPEKTSPMIMQGAQMMRSTIQGMKGNMVLSDRGNTFEVGYDMSTVPEAMRASLSQMEDSLRNMTTALPEEPVGVGATWRLYQTLVMNGIKIHQRADFTLKKIDGAMLYLDAEIAQEAPAQSVSLPGLPPGAQAEVLSFWSTGTSHISLDLKGIVPYEMKATVKNRSRFKIVMNGDTTKMKTKSTSELSLERKN